MTYGIKLPGENRGARGNGGSAVPCHAPFVNMYFARNGNMLPCCFNQNTVYGHWPETSIREAWGGGPAGRLRAQMETGSLSPSCGFCRKEIALGKRMDGKLCFYDEYVDPVPQMKNASRPASGDAAGPRVFEFELHNTCNLECAMCFGIFSSAIRRNREQLPTTPPPFGPDFVDQVVEFFPHLTDMKFLGGEPLLIDLYRRIWEKTAALKPEMRIHITTSAGVLPANVMPILERLKVGVVVSLDSLDPGLFARIRKNARLGPVLEHLEYFRALAQRKGTFAGLAVCPMTCNWHEMPDLVRFAGQKSMSIFFNSVWGPDRLCLRFLEVDELTRILDEFSSVELPAGTPLQKANRRAFEELVLILAAWREEARETGRWLDRKTLRCLLREEARDGQGGMAGRIAGAMLEEMGTGLDDDPLSASRRPKLIALAKQYGYVAAGLAYLELILKVREAACGADAAFARKIAVVERDLRASVDPATFVTTLVQLGFRWCLDMIESSDEHLLIWKMLDA